MGTRGQPNEGMCIVVCAEVRPCAREEAERLVHRDSQESRKEEGVLRMDGWIDPKRPTLLAMVGQFNSKEAAESHMKTGQVRAWWDFLEAGNIIMMDRSDVRPLNMQTKTKKLGTNAPVAAIIKYRVKADRRGEHDKLIDGIVRDTRLEDETLHFDLMQGVDDENKFVIYGMWPDEESFKRHHAGPACKRFDRFEQDGGLEEPTWFHLYQAADLTPCE